MEDQAEIFILDQREETKGAFRQPLHDGSIRSLGHHGFNVGRRLPDHIQRVSVPGQQRAVIRPRVVECLVRVVEQVDIARNPRRLQKGIEGHTPGNVAFAAVPATLGN